MKNIKQILLLFSILLTLNACDKDDTELPQNTHEDAYGDVILKKMYMMGEYKYALVAFAGGNEIDENGSKVVGPDGTELDLHEFWAGPGKLTGVLPTGLTPPQPGTYTFTLKFKDGYTKTLIDVLEATEIDVPVITVNYDKAAKTIEVSWTEVPNADLYCVKLTDLDMANYKPYFKMAQLPTSQTSLTIYIDGSNGWLRPVSELQEGTQYWVAVAAKKVEQGKPVSGTSTDFQTSSCQKTKITY